MIKHIYGFVGKNKKFDVLFNVNKIDNIIPVISDFVKYSSYITQVSNSDLYIDTKNDHYVYSIKKENKFKKLNVHLITSKSNIDDLSNENIPLMMPKTDTIKLKWFPSFYIDVHEKIYNDVKCLEAPLNIQLIVKNTLTNNYSKNCIIKNILSTEIDCGFTIFEAIYVEKNNDNDNDNDNNISNGAYAIV
jgi:hypothetical protein